MDGPITVEAILAHHGIKGQKWGVRKQHNTVASPHSGSGVKGIEHYPKAQAAAMTTVTKKMEKHYGFKIGEFVPLTEAENRKYIAYVKPNNKGVNVVHMTNHPLLKKALDLMQDQGWFVPAGGKVIESNLTHEAAHGLFHARNLEGKGFIARVKAPMPIDPMRKSAWAKAEAQAKKDGDVTTGFLKPHAQYQIAKKLSKYADSSMFSEEHEAEIFSAYHWSPNPPKFVDAFMNDIHSSMGKKVQPFSGRKVTHAS